MNWQDRATRTNAALAEFRGKPFAWAGRANCIHLARAVLVAFGHMPPPVPMFRTAIGAKRALRKRGFADLGALIGSMLPEIPPAAMWPGDIALLPDEHGLGALVIADGTGQLLGWHDSDLSALKAIRLNENERASAAWRV